MTRNVEPGKSYPLPDSFMEPDVTHYGEICQHDEEFISVHHIDEMQILILGDEPSMSSWLSYEEGGLLVRWIYADEEPQMQEIYNNFSTIDWEFDFLMEVKEEKWYLFDSAEMGIHLFDEKNLKARGYNPQTRHQPILLQPGKYEIYTGEYQPADNTLFRIHPLQKNRIVIYIA